MDIGFLINKHTKSNTVDISRVMDELNTLDSYKPFQKAIKDSKELKKANEQIAYLELKIYSLDEEIDDLNDRLKD